MRATGVRGELRVGHKRAAVLGAWEIEQNGKAFVLRATVGEADDFWINERPIDVVLDVGGVEWLWRHANVKIGGGEIVSAITERPLVEAKTAKVAV